MLAFELFAAPEGHDTALRMPFPDAAPMSLESFRFRSNHLSPLRSRTPRMRSLRGDPGSSHVSVDGPRSIRWRERPRLIGASALRADAPSPGKQILKWRFRDST